MKHFILAHKLALVVALAVLVRLAILVGFSSIFAFDQAGAIHGSEAYDTYARNLLAMGVYGRTPGVPDAAVPPLYSYALAAVYGLFGRGYLQAGLFHIALDALSLAMLYHTARRLLPRGEVVGLLAALLYAFYPYLIFQNLTLIDTPFFMALLYAFVLLLVLLRGRPALDRGTWILALLAGVVLGLSMLTRPLLPLLALLAAVWFLFRLSLKQTILRLLPVALAGVLVVVPWIARNYQVYGVFIPVALNSGDNFFQGNNRYTIPFFRAGYDAQWIPIADMDFATQNSPEANRDKIERGLEFLCDNPGKIPELLWVKFLVYWSIDVAPRFNPQPGEQLDLDEAGNVVIRRNTGQGEGLLYHADDPVNAYNEPLFDVIGRWLHRLYWGGLFLLGWLGLAVTAHRWRDVSLLWFIQISMTVLYLIFHPSTRYRSPTDPFWFMLSAAALVWLWGKWQRKPLTNLEAKTDGK